jgi:hypothetical protein
MKKNIKKLQLKKKTIVSLNQAEKEVINGGASATCFTIRICPTPPESGICPTSF